MKIKILGLLFAVALFGNAYSMENNVNFGVNFNGDQQEQLQVSNVKKNGIKKRRGKSKAEIVKLINEKGHYVYFGLDNNKAVCSYCGNNIRVGLDNLKRHLAGNKCKGSVGHKVDIEKTFEKQEVSNLELYKECRFKDDCGNCCGHKFTEQEMSDLSKRKKHIETHVKKALGNSELETERELGVMPEGSVRQIVNIANNNVNNNQVVSGNNALSMPQIQQVTQIFVTNNIIVNGNFQNQQGQAPIFGGQNRIENSGNNISERNEKKSWREYKKYLLGEKEEEINEKKRKRDCYENGEEEPELNGVDQNKKRQKLD